MEYGFFQKHFQSRGIETVVPNEAHRHELDGIIWEELSHGMIKPDSRTVARSMLNNLANDGAEAMILGCTELCLLIKPEDSPRPLYDTTELHAKAILRFALNDHRIERSK
jgi:aspartate racemase